MVPANKNDYFVCKITHEKHDGALNNVPPSLTLLARAGSREEPHNYVEKKTTIPLQSFLFLNAEQKRYSFFLDKKTVSIPVNTNHVPVVRFAQGAESFSYRFSSKEQQRSRKVLDITLVDPEADEFDELVVTLEPRDGTPAETVTLAFEKVHEHSRRPADEEEQGEEGEFRVIEQEEEEREQAKKRKERESGSWWGSSSYSNEN